MCTRDINSDPHAFMACTLPVEPYPPIKCSYHFSLSIGYTQFILTQFIIFTYDLFICASVYSYRPRNEVPTGQNRALYFPRAEVTGSGNLVDEGGGEHTLVVWKRNRYS